MKIKNIEIPEDVERILSRFHEADYAAYLVGGCVRDCLMGNMPHDWDICTSATPAQVKQVFADKPYTVVPAGIKHGTVMVVVHGRPYEITVFRKKSTVKKHLLQGRKLPGTVSAASPAPVSPALENRDADGAFCHTYLDNPLYEDLGLRDFTVNSMAWSPEEGLIDPYHGERDLAAALLRCAGSAYERLSEDPLRILRALRFAAHFSFSIDPELDAAIHELYPLLKDVAVERITSEFYRFMQSSGVKVAEMLRNYPDVACFLVPELKPLIGFDQHNHHHVYDVWEHTLKAMEACPDNDIVLKFTILFHDMGKAHTFTMDNQGVGHFYGHADVSKTLCKNIMNRLRFDGKTEEEVMTLVEVHDARVEPTTRSIRRWLNRIGEEQFRRLLQMKRCDAAGQNPVYWPDRDAYISSLEKAFEEVKAQDACFNMKDLAVKGSDLIAVGYERGAILGKCLKRLLDEVIDERLPNDKQVLLSQAVFWLNQADRVKE